jgi:hypothetical protein
LSADPYRAENAVGPAPGSLSRRSRLSYSRRASLEALGQVKRKYNAIAESVGTYDNSMAGGRCCSMATRRAIWRKYVLSALHFGQASA